jgi:hypothetical protein
VAGTSGGIVEYVRPGQHSTFTAGAAITGGNLVRLTGNRSVIATASTAQANVAGIALFTAASGDTNLTVAANGVYPVVAQGAIATGDDLVSGSVAGSVAALAAASTAVAADINNARNIVGRAFEAISNTNTGRGKLKL